jgi:phosphoglycerate dehydrogenase-like enzyme
MANRTTHRPKPMLETVDLPLVVITDSNLPSDRAEETVLEAAGLRTARASATTAQDIVAAAAEATALIVQWAPVTAEVLDQLPRCRFISRLGIGYDMIDVEAATARGIAVANTPEYCVEEVATHTVALALSLLRGLPELDRAVRAGRWSAVADAPRACRPSLTTIGVIGFGRIGSLVARSLTAIGFRVVVSDPYVSPAAVRAAGHEHAPLAEALARADLITLHTPLTDETRHMLDRSGLDGLAHGVAVVNTCRGGLIDEEALADALESGRVSAAALDVFEAEPLAAASRLRSLPNVLLTPHAAWHSPAALLDLPLHASRQVVDFLAGRPVMTIVNPDYAARPVSPAPSSPAG